VPHGVIFEHELARGGASALSDIGALIELPS